jgi:hypothetical protein
MSFANTPILTHGVVVMVGKVFAVREGGWRANRLHRKWGGFGWIEKVF